MGRIVGLLVVVGIGVVIVVGMLTTGSSDEIECETPVLAAGPAFATSCVESVAYEGTTYFVECVHVHPSRVGSRFVDEGGETYFDGASSIHGVPRTSAFILEGGHCPRGLPLAASDAFTRMQAGLLTVPVGVRNEQERARNNRPWIVPGRREVPQVLKLEAVLEDGTILITNRNRFTWRQCDQLQIESDDEWAPWEARPVEQVRPDDTVSYPAKEFSRDSSGIEELSSEATEGLRGAELILMCDAPKGRALGVTDLS